MATWSWDDIDWGDSPPIIPKTVKGVKRPRGRPKTDKGRVAQVRDAARAGITAAEAGEKLGMTRNAVLGLAHRNGINFHGVSRGRPHKNTSEMRDKVREWLSKRPFAKHEECAAAMGISAPTMAKIANTLRAEWENKND